MKFTKRVKKIFRVFWLTLVALAVYCIAGAPSRESYFGGQ